ncbi:MAG: hypothetical protein ACOCP6_01345 [Desulfosalsimonas sp.]
MNKTALQIANRIQDLFDSGIRLGSDVIHYIESVAGAAGADGLIGFLEDEENCDSQSLYQLIFYPEERDQLLFEPLLEAGSISRQDLRDIERHLASEKILTRLIFPDKTTTPQIRIPEDTLCMYIRRLNLGRRIPEEVAEAISLHAAGHHLGLRLRVRLRNSRFGFGDNVVSFLCSYLKRMPVNSEHDIEQASWMIDFLDQAGAKTDIYAALMEEKHRTAEMIRQAASSERRLTTQPVEALIMQGVSIPCISADEARERINTIDRIALAVFGKTEAVESESPLNLGVFNARDDMDSVIRILS